MGGGDALGWTAAVSKASTARAGNGPRMAHSGPQKIDSWGWGRTSRDCL